MRRLTFLFVCTLMLSCSQNEGNSKNKVDPIIKKSNTLYSDGQYALAKIAFEDVDSASDYKGYADSMVLVIDSLLSAQRRIDSIKLIEQKKIDQEKRINQLKTEIKSVKEFDNKPYRGKADLLTLEVALFGVWAKQAEESNESDNSEEKRLALELQRSLKNLQLSEFPKIRADYVNIVDRLLWEQDIDVSISGSRNTIMTLTGGVFAANKNIKEMQNLIGETAKLYRFKTVRYKWYKYDDEYTYYTLNPVGDGEVVE